MKDNSNFFDLLSYSSAGYLDKYDEGCALRELDFYFSNNINSGNFDIVNYERLIYIELRFTDNEEIQKKVQDLKQIICSNYIVRQKLLEKLVLRRTPV